MIKNTDFNSQVSELIKKRYSCRTYKQQPISAKDLTALVKFSDRCQEGTLGNSIRVKITAANKDDKTSLKKLGTYGFIKNPAGFIVGSTKENAGALEDFGYLLEMVILKATELGIGTCWLGGTFVKSRFSKLMQLDEGESIPAVISLGYPDDHRAWLDRTSRIYAGSDRRLPWDKLFFTDSFNTPMTQAQAAQYQEPLENLRLAPSASNKQPWRILRRGGRWHFYLQRANKYPPPVFNFLLGLADLQRIDIGIAMAHFDLSALELGLSGKWVMDDPGISTDTDGLEYNISWVSEP